MMSLEEQLATARKEIQFLGTLLLQELPWLQQMGYETQESKIDNPDSKSIFYRHSFINQKSDRAITFDLYPSNRDRLGNTLDVIFTKNLRPEDCKTSFSLDDYLAYKELKTTLRYEDRKKYVLTFDPAQMEESMASRVNEVFSLLKDELLSVVRGKKWCDIPIHDPRDDY